jgi:hypothetical protein
MEHSVYISSSSRDREAAMKLCSTIEQSGIRCWIAPRDISPGVNFGEAISRAIEESRAFILVVSSSANESAQIRREVEHAVSQQKHVIPVRIEDVQVSKGLEYFVSSIALIDAFAGPIEQAGQTIVKVLRRVLSPNEQTAVVEATTERPRSKGYVFLSYVEEDVDFVGKLRTVLKGKGYGYWDYLEGERDYQQALYREVEERIDNAAAFITIVSDRWRDRDWIAQEFTYAKEGGKPILVIQAKQLTKRLPIMLNLHTRIDMSEDFDQSTNVLYRELDRKGL